MTTHRPALVAILFTAVLASAGACGPAAPATGLGSISGGPVAPVNAARVGAPPASVPTHAATAHGAPTHAATTPPTVHGSAGSGGNSGSTGAQPYVTPSDPVGAVSTTSVVPNFDFALTYQEDPQMVCQWWPVASTSDPNDFYLTFGLNVVATNYDRFHDPASMRAITKVDGSVMGYPLFAPGINQALAVMYSAPKYRTVKLTVDLLDKDHTATNNHAATSIQIPNGMPPSDSFNRLTCYPDY